VIFNKPDTTLGGLAKRFVDLIRASPPGTIDMKGASVSLGVHKRRIYDITNVLEGIGLIAKNDKKCYEWLESLHRDPSRIYHDQTRKIDDLRRQVDSISEQERQIDEYLDYLYRNSLHFSPLSGRARSGPNCLPTGHDTLRPTHLPRGVEPRDALKHMYIRYSDVTGLERFYGSDAIIGIKAPVGTNLEVPDPDQGMQVGKRRYQMFLTSKLPEGSFAPGSRNNRGPIRVYLVRPEVKPDTADASTHASSRPAQVQEQAKREAGTAPKRGSYVEPELFNTQETVTQRAEQSPGALDRAPKRPYAQVLQPGAYPYLPPQQGPSLLQYCYHYPPDASARSANTKRPPYHPMNYPPFPPPATFASEVITPENDSEPSATKPKRNSEPVPPASSRAERHEDPREAHSYSSASLKKNYSQEHFSPLPYLRHPNDNLSRPSVTSHPTSPVSGPHSPPWPRSGSDRSVETPGKQYRHYSAASHLHGDHHHRPPSPDMSPTAVDQSELFAMPLQSPAGPRGSFGGSSCNTAVRASILLSPGASAPPGFSPHRGAFASSRARTIGAALPYPHPAVPPHLPLPSLSLATPPRGSGNKGVAPAKRPYKRRPRS
jgi:hypothetical protein